MKRTSMGPGPYRHRRRHAACNEPEQLSTNGEETLQGAAAAPLHLGGVTSLRRVARPPVGALPRNARAFPYVPTKSGVTRLHGP